MVFPGSSSSGESRVGDRLAVTLRIDRALRLVWESSASWTAASFVLLLLQGVLPLATLYLMKLIVDSVTLSKSGPEGSGFDGILLLISIAGLLALFSSFCRTAGGVVSEHQASLVSDHIQDTLHAKSVEIDLEYYENASYYDALHRAQQEAPFRPARIVRGLAQLLQSAVSLLAVLGLLIAFSWNLAAVLLVAAIPGVFVRLHYSDELYRWQKEATKRERKALYLHWMLTSDAHAKEVRIFDLGSLLKDRYSDLRQQLRGERLNLAYRKSAADLLSQASMVLALFGSLAFIAYAAVQGRITLGDLVMYFGAFQQGQGFMQSFLTSLSGLYEDNLFLTSLYDFLDLEPKVKEPSHPKALPEKMRRGLTLEGVSFRYPGSDSLVLENVTMLVPPGKTVALVGENGSGKTTLIKLLCRLYDPVEGTIALDGINLRDLRVSDLRRQISIVFQDYSRYNLSARENIGFGDVRCMGNTNEIIAAARCSGADRVIEGLKGGYDTVLGNWFEDGEELSIGEWQKVALARAFMRDSQLIVLDEPTSSLDPRAEDEVFQRFRELARGRTAVIISHRLSTTKGADCIYFLKKGRIVESGTHDNLMKSAGEYAQLFNLQARHYHEDQTARPSP